MVRAIRVKVRVVTSVNRVRLFSRLFVRPLVRVWNSKSIWRHSRMHQEPFRLSSRDKLYGLSNPMLKREAGASRCVGGHPENVQTGLSENDRGPRGWLGAERTDSLRRPRARNDGELEGNRRKLP
jgi:hypothetical protein